MGMGLGLGGGEEQGGRGGREEGFFSEKRKSQTAQDSLAGQLPIKLLFVPTTTFPRIKQEEQ